MRTVRQGHGRGHVERRIVRRTIYTQATEVCQDRLVGITKARPNVLGRCTPGLRDRREIITRVVVELNLPRESVDHLIDVAQTVVVNRNEVAVKPVLSR